MALQGVLGNVLGDGDHAAEGNVLQGIVYNNGGLIGTYDPGAGGVVPNANDVRLGVAVGVQPNFGTVRVPDETDVRENVAYDANDSRIGTLVSGTIPSVTDVRLGVAFGDNDALIGVLELPTESQVLIGIGYGAYGTEFEGSLVTVPGGTGLVLPPVNIDGSIRSPLIIGDDYTGDRAFQWQISPITGFSDSATVTFRGWKTCCNCCPESYDWEQTGSITNNTTSWDLIFDLLSDITNTLEPGTYDWAVLIEQNGVTHTITGSFEHSETEWIC